MMRIGRPGSPTWAMVSPLFFAPVQDRFPLTQLKAMKPPSYSPSPMSSVSPAFSFNEAKLRSRQAVFHERPSLLSSPFSET